MILLRNAGILVKHTMYRHRSAHRFAAPRQLLLRCPTTVHPVYMRFPTTAHPVHMRCPTTCHPWQYMQFLEKSQRPHV